MLADRFGGDMLVIAEHMSRACGCGYMKGYDISRERVASVLTCWDDISACFIINGGIVNGKNGLSDEFGHVIVAPEDEELCVCGKRGCLERVVSTARLRRLAEEGLNRFPDSALGRLLPDALTMREVFAASAKGDGLAQWLSGGFAQHFAVALRNLALVFNPDRVVLLGDYANADSVFLDTVRRELRLTPCLARKGHMPPAFPITVDTRSPAALCVDGAYALLIDRLFSYEATYA